MNTVEIKTRAGRSTMLSDKALNSFASNLRGELIRSGDVAYESARKVWNGSIDKKPALIIEQRFENQ